MVRLSALLGMGLALLCAGCFGLALAYQAAHALSVPPLISGGY